MLIQLGYTELMTSVGRRQFLGTGALAVAGCALAGLPSARAFASPVVPSSLTPALKERAFAAFHQHGALVTDRRVMAIADFALDSATPRFHLLDMASGHSEVLLVAHGRGSDPDHSGWVQSFSNIPGSNASSSGAYLAGESYIGQHGLSRRLAGLDPENDQAEARAIVIHPAWYVSDILAREKGKIGRSQGCFAFSEADISQVLSRLPQGSLLYAAKV
jgi:L,D-transpeptidase catalytic domain